MPADEIPLPAPQGARRLRRRGAPAAPDPAGGSMPAGYRLWFCPTRARTDDGCGLAAEAISGWQARADRSREGRARSAAARCPSPRGRGCSTRRSRPSPVDVRARARDPSGLTVIADAGMIAVMELHHSLTSPFSRSIRIVVLELGLQGRVRPVLVDPWTDAAYRAVNPKSQVPALVLEDGTALIDSAVIAQYLDHLAGGTLFADRWTTMRLRAIADGIAESAVRIVVEGRRPPSQRSAAYVARQFDAIDASLDLLERERAPLAEGMGDIALGVALAYLDFRFPDRPWRQGREFLGDYERAIAQRPSLEATRPPAP